MQTARTTIELDKDLLKKAKQKAIEEDKSLKEVIGEVLQKGLEGHRKAKLNNVKKRIKLKSYPLGVKGTLRRVEIYDWL